MELLENEVLISANAVKYHGIEYQDNYVVITQNRTRRRVYKGFYFDDTGSHIYVSGYCAGIFQHKPKEKRFIVNTLTKEWRDFQSVIIKHYKPERIEPKQIPPDANLIK